MISVVVVTLAALLLLAGQLGFLTGKAPKDIGFHNGRLKPPSTTSNSVSSQASLYPDHPQRAYADIAPLAYSGDGQAAMARLAALLASMPRTQVITREPGYLYAQSTTLLLRFTDDVEFALDEAASVIHLRSASRLGQKDFGANRKRMEALRAQWQH